MLCLIVESGLGHLEVHLLPNPMTNLFSATVTGMQILIDQYTDHAVSGDLI